MEHLDDNAASEFVSGALPKSLMTKVEGHLAACRECRALVAALAADGGTDSNVETVPHEKPSPSQVGELPRRTYTVGDKVGRYLVLSVLGAGGMGVVFAAYDPQLDRKVALKLLRSGIQLNTKDARARLRREAQAIAQLSHPNVVSVYDVGTTDDDDLYIAMEFVEGDTLTTWLKRWPRTWREIIDVFLQAGRGLVSAHSVGLLHRDFKPDNVLVGGDGRVRVTDFGLARSLIASITEESGRGATEMPIAHALHSPLTATGTVLGTPRYMPPEQLTGPNIDARSDQFSFCVALHEALYGQHPLPGSTSVSMLEKGDKALPPPEGTRVPSTIGRAVARGLETDRSKRFPTMAGLLAELVPGPQRSPARYVAMGLGAVLLVGVAMAAVYAQKEPPPVVQPLDNKGVQPLIDKINELQADRQRLINELKKRTDNAKQLEQLQHDLAVKDQQIQDLIGKVTQLQTSAPTKPQPPAKVVSQEALMSGAVDSARADLKGCFEEWGERHPDVAANLMVRLTVTADGIGHSASASGPDDHALKFCVADAVSRATFPEGSEQLDVQVAVHWADGSITLTPRVVGHREASGTIIDMH